jgi:hypothetical protein
VADVTGHISANLEKALHVYHHSILGAGEVGLAEPGGLLLVSKLAARTAGIFDIGFALRDYNENPTGDNEGKLWLSGVKWEALDTGNPYGLAVAAGITLGEWNYDAQQEWEERLPYIKGQVNGLERRIDELTSCTPNSCGEVINWYVNPEPPVAETIFGDPIPNASHPHDVSVVGPFCSVTYANIFGNSNSCQ